MLPNALEIGFTLARSLRNSILLRSSFVAHTVKCIRLLTPKAKFFYALIVVLQSIISILDLLGLALIMKIVLGFQSDSQNSSSLTNGALPFIGDFLSSVNPNLLLISVVVIFILKGAVALLLHTLTIKLMASETLKLITKLNKSIFENRTNLYGHLSNQDISFSIYNAAEIVFRDTLVPISIILADTVLLILISANLFISAQILFLPTTLYFIFIFALLRTIEKRSTRKALTLQWKNEILGRSLIQEATSSLRELYVSAKLPWMVGKIFQARSEGLRAGSVITIGQLRPKYFYEMALFGGIGVIALVSNISGNSKLILSFLTLFIISSSRMIPSLLRIQYYLGIFQKSQEQTSEIFAILDLIPKEAESQDNFGLKNNRVMVPNNFEGEIAVKSLSFSYLSEEPSPLIQDLNFTVRNGETLALVGPSGAGKSTLVDLILGYQKPNSGSVQISGLEPRLSFKTWPGRVAYVPQKVTIYRGTLFSNIAIGEFDESNIDSRGKAVELLNRVGLGSFLENLKIGLDTELSELGSSLSGGQIQRIGIARALFTDPNIMVFDESTSSLDSASEEAIMSFLLSFKGEKTLIFIAHRLSTIKTADRIIYLNNGKIEAEGDFQTLQELVPEFKKQVSFLNVNKN